MFTDKTKGVCDHKTSPAINFTGDSLNAGKRRPKQQRLQRTSPEANSTCNTMEINSYCSIIMLNINGLNVPIKRHRYHNRQKSEIHLYAVYKRLILDLKNTCRLKVRGWRATYHANGGQKNARVAGLYQTNWILKQGL